MKEAEPNTPCVLVTREDPEPVSAVVRLSGGKAFELPLLETAWLSFEPPSLLDDYDWVAFTSARAVEAVHEAALRNKWSWPPASKSAAVGNRTAHELQASGWLAECVSEQASAQSLVECMSKKRLKKKSVLFPCSSIADSTLPDGLAELGAKVDIVHVYETRTVWQNESTNKADLIKKIKRAFQADCIPTCASPSAVRALEEICHDADCWARLQETPIVVIGASTARSALELGLHPIEADGRSLACLARKAVEVGRG